MQEIPLYQKIAVDIAQRIVTDEFPIGTKISGRSMLSGYYQVSPETIRKAMSMLKSANVVSVSQGKEPTILSTINAHTFIEENKSMESIYSLKERFDTLMEQKNSLDQQIANIFAQIIEQSNKFREITPYNPIEIELSDNSYMVNKSVSETHFWQHTKTTVIALRRNKQLIMAPGPDEKFQTKDRIVIVGSLEAINKAIDFINNGIID